MLKDNQANIFNDLATLCEAGISVLDAARKIAISHPKIKAWSVVITMLERGSKLSLALGENHLVSRYEQELISVAEFAGRLSEGLRNIATSYDKRRSRTNRLKSKLYYPFAILLVGIIVSSILQISRNPDISKFDVFSKAIFGLIIAVALTRTLINFMQKDACTWLSFANQYSSSDWYKMQFQQVVFGALLWHGRSGIDFKTSFNRVSKLIEAKTVQKKLLMASTYCGQGITVTNAILQAELPITNEFKQILLTGEQSGRWESSVKKYLEQNELLLDLRIDNAFEWAPRIYYILIVLMAITMIF